MEPTSMLYNHFLFGRYDDERSAAPKALLCSLLFDSLRKKKQKKKKKKRKSRMIIILALSASGTSNSQTVSVPHSEIPPKKRSAAFCSTVSKYTCASYKQKMLCRSPCWPIVPRGASLAEIVSCHARMRHQLHLQWHNRYLSFPNVLE